MSGAKFSPSRSLLKRCASQKSISFPPKAKMKTPAAAMRPSGPLLKAPPKRSPEIRSLFCRGSITTPSLPFTQGDAAAPSHSGRRLPAASYWTAPTSCVPGALSAKIWNTSSFRDLSSATMQTNFTPTVPEPISAWRSFSTPQILRSEIVFFPLWGPTSTPLSPLTAAGSNLKTAFSPKA